jgi:Arc/MetJ family transcription regulator
MKINIEIDDELLEAARWVTGLKSEREVIDTALRHLVQLTAQERIPELRGKVVRDGNLAEPRQSRFLEGASGRSASNGLARLAGTWTEEEFKEFEAAMAGTDFPR